MPTKFEEKVYSVLKKVPRGKITTYGSIAKKLKSGPRAVGNALNKNPYNYSAISPEAVGNRSSTSKGKIEKNRRLFSVPCHRVVRSNGEIGGFASGTKNKIKLLKKESIEIKNGKTDLKKYSVK